MSPTPTPFWPTTASGWAPVVTLVVVVVGAVVAWRQLEQAVRTRHASLLSELSRRWSDKRMEESQRLADFYGEDLLERFRDHLEHGDPEIAILLRGPDFFEDLAVLVHDGGIGFDLVMQSLGRMVPEQWELWEPTVAYLREEDDDTQIYSNFEKLARRIEEASKKGRR